MKQRLLAATLVALFILSGCAGEDSDSGRSNKKKSSKSSPEVSEAISPMPSADEEPATEDIWTTSRDRDLLLSFLDGEVAAKVGENVNFDLDNTTSLSMQEYAWREGAADDAESWEVSYTLMETMGGREMLAVYCNGMYQWGDFGSYCIFGVYDDEVRLTYYDSFGYRIQSALYQDLILTGGGSSGAGDHTVWCGYIADDGNYREAYQLETLGGPWVAMYASSVFGFDTDWANNCECYILTTDDGTYYELIEGEGTNAGKLAQLRNYFAQMGMIEIDDMDDALRRVEKARGVEDPIPFEDWILWGAKD